VHLLLFAVLNAIYKNRADGRRPGAVSNQLKVFFSKAGGIFTIRETMRLSCLGANLNNAICSKRIYTLEA
jgi:hypothetical protein